MDIGLIYSLPFCFDIFVIYFLNILTIQYIPCTAISKMQLLTDSVNVSIVSHSFKKWFLFSNNIKKRVCPKCIDICVVWRMKSISPVLVQSRANQNRECNIRLSYNTAGPNTFTICKYNT